MNVVFLTMVPSPSLSQRGIYTDLLRHFVAEGHKVYVVFPRERRLRKRTEAYEENGTLFLAVRTLDLRRSSLIEKGLGQLLVDGQYERAIRKYWKEERFDLILYSTPPITLIGTIKFLKRRNSDARTYLLLKDIFPQNAVDIGLMTTSGIKGVLYRFYRRKEKKLYAISDNIGCMSPANVEYVLKHNPEISASRVEVAPNSVAIDDGESGTVGIEKEALREKYGVPSDLPVFIYGGNLGKPQGISFLIECLKANGSRKDCFFMIIGSGTEYSRVKAWYDETHPKSVLVMNGIPKSEYDRLVQSCDVGLVFLDHRFTIPNYPSRLLSYLENRMPVLCATDCNTDMGRIAEENGYGYWCESDSVVAFTALLDRMLRSDRKAMGEKGYRFLTDNYLVKNTYNVIVSHIRH